jgi:thioredoxin 1
MLHKIRIRIGIVGLLLLTIGFLSFTHEKENKDKGIQFIEADWSKALSEAKTQHKKIFLDAYASWCGPCKQLKKQTFPDPEAAAFFNANFINVAINMEKGVGPSLLEKYRITAYPTLLITDENGNLITYTRGLIGPKDLIAFGKYGLKLGK